MKQVIYTIYDEVTQMASPIQTGYNVESIKRQLKLENGKIPKELSKNYNIIILGKVELEKPIEDIEIKTFERQVIKLEDILQRQTATLEDIATSEGVKNELG